MKTNNVTRLLQSRKIPFTIFELPSEKRGAIETARILNVSPEIVYKTIVVTRENGGKPILAVIPGPDEVDLKKLAEFLDEKKVHLPTQNEAEQLTRLQAGGISPLALMNKGYAVVLDQASLQLEQIHISGGERGLEISLPVKDFIELTQARVAKISTQAVSPSPSKSEP
jgi:Cys-tRNA(Pro)/Cys-tRNA(Cys) deacylase